MEQLEVTGRWTTSLTGHFLSPLCTYRVLMLRQLHVKYVAYKRLDPRTQSCTIDTGNAHSNYFHPLFHRIPTIRESARLQSFPDSFEFQGQSAEILR